MADFSYAVFVYCGTHLGILDGVLRPAQRAGGIDIAGLAGDIAATIIVEHPGRAGLVNSGAVRVVHAHKLPQRVVGLGGRLAKPMTEDRIIYSSCTEMGLPSVCNINGLLSRSGFGRRTGALRA